MKVSIRRQRESREAGRSSDSRSGRNQRIAAFFIVSFVVGLLITEAIPVIAGAGFSAAPRKKLNLAQEIRSREQERERLKTELAVVRARLDGLERDAADQEGVLDDFERQLFEARAMFGMTPVKGPGLVVELSDNPSPPSTEDPNNYIVHDYDLRTLVNALFQGEAEAIAVNGERQVSVSCIRCVGPTVLTNARRIVPPFTVKAIGDQAKLRAALYENEECAALLTRVFPQYGIAYSIKDSSEMSVPAYKGSASVRVGRVVSGR